MRWPLTQVHVGRRRLYLDADLGLFLPYLYLTQVVTEGVGAKQVRRNFGMPEFLASGSFPLKVHTSLLICLLAPTVSVQLQPVFSLNALFVCSTWNGPNGASAASRYVHANYGYSKP